MEDLRCRASGGVGEGKHRSHELLPEGWGGGHVGRGTRLLPSNWRFSRSLRQGFVQGNRHMGVSKGGQSPEQWTRPDLAAPLSNEDNEFTETHQNQPTTCRMV